MNRRGFLGWLGGTAGTVAIYKQVEIPSTLEQVNPTRLDELVQESPGECYVIKNQGQGAVVVNYQRRGGSIELPPSRFGVLHVSTLLLPGEELTITAVPAKV